MEYPRQVIEDLVDGTLPWQDLKDMMSAFKDPGRFDTYVSVLQGRVPWNDRIVLPLSDNLLIVRTPDRRLVTKSRGGFDFGDYRRNWKLEALIFERDSDELMEELYPRLMGSDPRWMTLREYYCPASLTLLEVEAVPPRVSDHQHLPARPRDLLQEVVKTGNPLTCRWRSEASGRVRRAPSNPSALGIGKRPNPARSMRRATNRSRMGLRTELPHTPDRRAARCSQSPTGTRSFRVSSAQTSGRVQSRRFGQAR